MTRPAKTRSRFAAGTGDSAKAPLHFRISLKIA
jgi:hypothetical protein